MIRIILLIVALGSGGAAGWLTLNAQDAPAPTAAPAPKIVERPTVDILVASVDVAPGQAVSEANLQWAPWPENAVGAKFILRSARPDAITELAGQLARREILAQEPVAPEKLMVGGFNPLATALAAGKRAAAVRITAETTAGGFILPNDRVDVLHTVVANGPDGNRRATTMTILHDVPVLAIDQTFQSDGGAGKSKGAAIGRTATLELTPEQSERIVAAESSGTVSLVLRPVNDRTVPTIRPEPAASKPPIQRAPETIRITRGMQVQVVRRPGMPDQPMEVAQP